MAGTRRLIVLAKPPLPGRCKSRLAVGIGSDAAARLARAMLRDTWSQVARLASEEQGLDGCLALSDAPHRYPLLTPAAPHVTQPSGDLGQRMARLAADALDEVDAVLLLGADSPGLPAAHVRAAWKALESNDLVLGANADGGFWCVGARRGAHAVHDPGWLDDIDWTRDDTAAPVRRRARQLGLSVGDAPDWFDVDRAADLPRLTAALDIEPLAAPATARELHAERAAPTLSVVIANLDEGLHLDHCLAELANQPGNLELIVADGGSADGSPQRAATDPAVTVCVAPRGRGSQFAAGAAFATTDALLFLHADVRLPPDGTRLVHDALADDRHEAGCFITRTRPDPSLPNRAGPLLRLADLRSRVTRHPYGDQALFMSRRTYQDVGGYRDLPIMEDYDLSRRLAARRKLARIRTPVSVSGRRMQARPIRSAILMQLIPPLYRMGISPSRLARLYRS